MRNEISDRLRSERDRIGFSQQALADLCGISLRSQQNYEKGERSPDADYLSAIAAIGINVLYVLTGQSLGTPVAAPALPKEEADWLDIYRNSTPEVRVVLKAAGDAHTKSAKRRDKAA